MSDYHFETREFGVSDEGIHLLRNGFNYNIYEYSDIMTMSIERGKVIKNWMAILVIGIGLLGFAIWYSLGMFGIIINKEVPVISIEEIIVPLFPLLIGSYCVFAALRTGMIIRIIMNDGTTDSFPLRDLETFGQMDDFKKFIDDRRRMK